MKELGQVRSTGTVIVLTMVTLGLYGLVWNYRNFEEVRKFRGKGVGGGVGILLSLVCASPFVLPSYVHDMYVEANEDPPVSATTGLWFLPGVLLLGIGPLVYISKVQNALNLFWQLQEPGTAPQTAAAPAAS
jgi:hypothetical protein